MRRAPRACVRPRRWWAWARNWKGQVAPVVVAVEEMTTLHGQRGRIHRGRPPKSSTVLPIAWQHLRVDDADSAHNDRIVSAGTPARLLLTSASTSNLWWLAWYASSMPKQRNEEPADWREGRRLRAWDLHQQGWKQKDIAVALGVTQGAVSQWIKRGNAGGVPGLRRRTAPGSAPRLNDDQREQLRAALARGAPAFGFSGDVWTTKRIAALIKDLFGVSCHPAHVSRIVRALNQSVQLPQPQATQRDDAAIETWHTQRWPALKKRQQRKGALSSG